MQNIQPTNTLTIFLTKILGGNMKNKRAQHISRTNLNKAEIVKHDSSQIIKKQKKFTSAMKKPSMGLIKYCARNPTPTCKNKINNI